jgi:molecular chaperone DnaK
VLQGERAEARYNRTLGKFSLDGLMPAPRGVPKVEVSFDIDANGILSVHAKDMATSKDQHITITGGSGLSEAEIQKMVKDAAEHETEDKSRREQVERRNKLDNLAYTLEKTLTENKEKISAEDVTLLEGLIKDGRQAIELQDDARVVTAIEKLEKEAHRVAAAMYQGAPPPNDASAAPGQGGTPEGQAPPNASKKNVVDAEFEDSPPP